MILNFQNFVNIKNHECCTIWLEVGSDTVLVHKANIQAKLDSGTSTWYILQSNKAKFDQYEVSSDCPLCGNSSENIQHFLPRCEKLQTVRNPYIKKLQYLLEKSQGLGWWNNRTKTERYG